MLIASVTTLKDELPAVQRFVEANLANGIDHLFVFLDGRDDAVAEWLGSRSEVTLVVTDKEWWAGNRPQLLNKRQRVNANLIKALLATHSFADWLFHIDSDEVALVDRQSLAHVPTSELAVRLVPLESVSVMNPGAVPTLFKRLLKQPELDLLWALGELEEATNSRYFRSYIIGKIGIRPTLETHLKIHNLADRKNKNIKPVRMPGMHVLHYESYSGEQFVRKWKAMIGSGPSINFGAHRLRLAHAMRELMALPLEPEALDHYLGQIYRRHMADPVETLAELGLLVTMDPLQGKHRPLAPTAEDLSAARAFLDAMRTVDKQRFLPDASTPRQVRRLVAEALRTR